MTWSPIITSPSERTQIVEVLGEIVSAVEDFHARNAYEPGSNPASDLLDIAVLRHYLALDNTISDDDDASSNWIALALERFEPRFGLALFGGFCELGWSIAHLADRASADEACASIDKVVATALASSWHGDYDLVSGLVGMGVYAIERGPAGRTLVVAVLDQLERLAVSRSGGLAWYTNAASLGPWERERAPDGYWNLGVSHGIGGVIGFLAALVTSDVERARASTLLRGAIAYALSIAPSTTGRFAAWEHEARADGRGPDDAPVGRLAWCYGDLGMALVLRHGALAVEDRRCLQIADELARQCTTRDSNAAFILDAGVCHGRAGVAHLFQHLACVTGDPRFGDAARGFVNRLLASRDARPLAGFPAFVPPADAKLDASAIGGAVGVGLVLHAAISEVPPMWSRRFLLDEVHR